MSLDKGESLVVSGVVSIKQSLEARIPLQLLHPGTQSQLMKQKQTISNLRNPPEAKVNLYLNFVLLLKSIYPVKIIHKSTRCEYRLRKTYGTKPGAPLAPLKLPLGRAPSLPRNFLFFRSSCFFPNPFSFAT